MCAKFTKLSSEDLPTLKNALIRLLPQSAQMLNIVNLAIVGKLEKLSDVEFSVYQDQNQVELINNDPFIICYQRIIIQSEYAVLIKAPKDVTDKMIETFDNFLDWDKIRLFSCINQDFFSRHLKHLLIKHGNVADTPDGDPCESYAAFELDPTYNTNSTGYPPEGDIEIKELSIQDSEQVTRNYAVWSGPHSQMQIEKSMQILTSAGVYIKGELVSWAIFSQVGLINVLHTEEPHRRKGFSQMVLRNLRQKVISMGFIAIGECEALNPTSRGQLKRSGFQLNDYTNWIHFRKG